MIELYNIDCMEYMKDQPDNAFDLAIVDPPYGIGENGSTNKSRGKLAIAKDYKAFAGGDVEPPKRIFNLWNPILYPLPHLIDLLGGKDVVPFASRTTKR